MNNESLRQNYKLALATIICLPLGLLVVPGSAQAAPTVYQTQDLQRLYNASKAIHSIEMELQQNQASGSAVQPNYAELLSIMKGADWYLEIAIGEIVNPTGYLTANQALTYAIGWASRAVPYGGLRAADQVIITQTISPLLNDVSASLNVVGNAAPTGYPTPTVGIHALENASDTILEVSAFLTNVANDTPAAESTTIVSMLNGINETIAEAEVDLVASNFQAEQGLVSEVESQIVQANALIAKDVTQPMAKSLEELLTDAHSYVAEAK